ncbi:MAG: UDP-N-acetylmuramoyl-L-alanine--D-glutamate ligase [bacterium]
MQVAILGYGKQGKSAHEYWGKQGHQITICDQNQDLELPEGTKSQLGENWNKNLDQFDLLIRSPFVHPREITKYSSPDILTKVATVTDEFLKVCPSKNVIGITGTKGKGTTSTLVAKMLEADGKKVHLGGNIGIPPLDMLKSGIKRDDWVVLELANFQLIDIKHSPHIGVCLMVVPEHLDWHTNDTEYYNAKKQMFVKQRSEDIAIYFANNKISTDIASAGSSRKIPYYLKPGAIVKDDKIMIDGQEIIETKDIKLLGAHNWQNACAAVTVLWQISKNSEAARKVLSTFAGSEFRLEFRREVNNVKYYNDSFGTTPETAIVAMQAFKEPKVIILGGSDKGANYDSLAAEVLKQNTRTVLLIGDQAKRIEESLKKVGFKDYMPGGDNMKEIVKNASAQAMPGDVVLLSTACASFGMFKNYQDRGEQFNQAVAELI